MSELKVKVLEAPIFEGVAQDLVLKSNNVNRIVIANTGPVSIQSNLSYSGTLTGNTGIINIGSGQIYKDASGNVGIGTASPASKLHVVGSFRQTGATVPFEWTVNAGAADFYKLNAVGFADNLIVANSSGNVGIGTVSPSGKLHVNGGTFDSFTISGNSTNSVGMRFQNSAASSRNYNIGSSGGGPSPAGTFFIYDDTASATRMTIDSSGNVGIGTTSNLASSKLDVRGRIRTGTGNSSGDSEVVWSNYASATSAWNVSVRQDVGGANNDLKFLRFDSSGNYQGVAMQIDSAGGNLLVGTTSDPYGTNYHKLVVSNKGLFQSTDGNQCLTMQSLPSSGTRYYAEFRVGSGIGSATGSITTTGTTTSYNTTSDYRLKENVAPMTGALAKIAELKPCTYTWKSNGSAGQGFIAHELQEVVPDCVTGTKDAVDKDGKPQYQGVDTSFLVATLVSAIQELTARLEVLENK
jgi:hypothetical protein